jgi:archaellum component FlaC
MSEDIKDKLQEINKAASKLYELLGEIDPESAPLVEEELQSASEMVDDLTYTLSKLEELEEQFDSDQIEVARDEVGRDDLHAVAAKLKSMTAGDNV